MSQFTLMKWLLLRGLARDSRHWGTFPQVFKETEASHSFVTLDLPGMGSESHRTSPNQVQGICQDLRQRWKRIRNQEPDKEWGILGLSLGGMVTLRWLSDHPQDFKHAVVINCSASKLNHPHQRLRRQSWKEFSQAALSQDARTKEACILDFTSNIAHRESSEWLTLWTQYAQSEPISSRNAAAPLRA